MSQEIQGSRVESLPDREVFYVDVGNMSHEEVKKILEQIKSEIKAAKNESQAG